MATFLANEINYTEGDITGPTVRKDKKLKGIWKHFFWVVD